MDAQPEDFYEYNRVFLCGTESHLPNKTSDYARVMLAFVKGDHKTIRPLILIFFFAKCKGPVFFHAHIYIMYNLIINDIIFGSTCTCNLLIGPAELD